MASILKVDDLRGNTSAGNITITSEGGAATMQLQQGVAKSWNSVQMDSSNTINDSFNQASFTDNGTGQGQTNFTNNMSANTYDDGIISGSNVNSRIVGYDGTTSRFGTDKYAYRSYTSSASTEDKFIRVQLLGDLA
jgi:hypothetical protein